MNQEIPTILMKNLVILPNQEIKTDIKTELSKKTVFEASKNNNGFVLITSPINDENDLPKVGVIAKIKSKIELTNNNLRVTFRGKNRVNIIKYFNKEDGPLLYTNVADIGLISESLTTT